MEQNITLPGEFITFAARERPQLVRTWHDEDTELLRTISGSRLYGLATADSDEDYYVVTPTPMSTRAMKHRIGAKQRLDGNLDTVAVDYKSFIHSAENGVPQALEAMFSRETVSPFFEEFRLNWFASDPRTVDRYLRTIKSFALNDESGHRRVKYLRHAVRLAFNLDELVHTGRFNPTLTPAQAEFVKRVADYSPEAYRREVNAVSPFEQSFQSSK